MADVKVPAKLHLMSKASQKAWYSKHGMRMPDDLEGKSAAAAKKVKAAPRKMIDIDPGSVRALNAARQQAYMAKGGRQPIGAMGSGGSNVMAGGGQSTIKDLKASIKAGFNPKVSLDPYESERAKKVGPRSLKMKKEEVQVDEAMSPEAAKKRRIFDLKLKMIKKVANYKAYTKSSKVDAPRNALDPAKDMKLTPRPPSGSGKDVYREETQIDEVTKKEAESMLGGSVKEKPKMPPGKQPAGYRYVRSLARKAMKKGLVKEEIKDQADAGEYDYEGDMAKSQLRSIMANSKRMHDMLEENTNLPEWVQSKITLAEDYISTAANYMEGEMNEELIRQEEAIFEAMKKMEIEDDEEEMDDEDEMEDDETEMSGKKKKMSEKVEQVDEANMRFDYEAAARPKSSDVKNFLNRDKNPRAAAASKKYIRRMTKLGGLGPNQTKKDTEAHMKANFEEVVTEAEGKVAVTPKEKELAAHHGDKTKITYGDVIKARIKSSKEKLMKGKE
jgi:hypothetical protein